LTGAGENGSAIPPRFVLQAQPEIGDGEGSLPSGIYVLTNDGKGLAEAVADQIAKAGAQAVILNPSALSDPERIQTALAEVDIKRVVGLVHLAALNDRRLRLDANPSDWRSEIERNEFSAYFLIKHLGERLSAGGRVVLATGLGGKFGRDAAAHAGLVLQGGVSGLAKSLKEEWPQCSLKAVDLDPKANIAANAGHLIAELKRPGGRIEVGYPGGVRTVFRTVAAPFDPRARSNLRPDSSWVVLATGGARGVTAQLCMALAASGATLILAGRAPLPGPESPDIRDLQTVDALRRHFIGRSKASGGAPAKIAEIENAVRAVVQDREITRNIEDMRKAGAKVIYRQLDVRDHAAVGTMLAELYAEFGHIDGIVHGAGVIEDRLLADKTPESWHRVVGTKIDGALALLRHLRLDELKFLAFLTSVAGRYGNRGQSDYAMANELLNRIAWQVHAAHRPNLKVSAINWGPWLATRHGSGMVSEETRRKFEAKGLRLVDPDGGAAFFLEEILRGPQGEVEVVAGAGTWEQHESEVAALPIPALDVPAMPATTRPPLVFKASQETAAKGGIRLPRRLSLETDPYLNQHKLAGVPVLPIAVALEMMAEAAEQVWPDWHVAEMVDLRVLHGVQLDDGPSRDIEIVVSASQHGDAEGFLASVELRSGDGKGRRHYRASAQMRSNIPQPEPSSLTIVPRRSPVTAVETYRNILFHGPCFQTIAVLSGLDESGAAAQVRSTQPGEFIPTAPAQARWLFDPGLVDAALQLGWTWSRHMNANAALCHGIARVRRFAPGLPALSTMKVAARKIVSETGFQADVEVTGPDGKLLLALEQIDFTASENLNRLSGWQGEIRIAPEPSA
jgi:NAD(P)-dependent dehydrogenase (short-subunit alcohol dehydrogenase family)